MCFSHRSLNVVTRFPLLPYEYVSFPPPNSTSPKHHSVFLRVQPRSRIFSLSSEYFWPAKLSVPLKRSRRLLGGSQRTSPWRREGTQQVWGCVQNNKCNLCVPFSSLHLFWQQSVFVSVKIDMCLRVFVLLSTHPSQCSRVGLGDDYSSTSNLQSQQNLKF